ncbi:MAG: EAL domain-containing protein [Leptolyngbyaceae bacterium]|nr:EAL domain-containing protein [Leptolyngbyaceae bacterium]
MLVISYFQAIAYTRTNLESIVKKATEETDKLLKDADTILHRSNVDLQNADSKTSVNILQRQIYTDFRFREAGIITSEGYLTLSSLGIIDPPIPISFSPKAGFNPNEPDLQVLGSGRSQVMREESIALALKGDENIGGLYLLVDPVVLTYFLEAIPNLDLGPDGYIAFMTSNDRLLSSIGASPQNIFASLQNPSSHALRSIRTTDDKKITIVGEVRRQWALRYWLRELSISAPLTVIISGLLSYFFIRQVHQSNSLDYELKLGLAQNEFEIHYQPIIDLETRRCIGSEALLRWRHPQRGLIYPGLFIPIAEQTGFILSLTEWLIQKVIQDQTVLQTRFPDLYTSVNLSPTQLNTGNIERLVQTLNTAVEQPEQFSEQSNVRITFEITENKIVEAQEQVVQDSIARLKLWGTRFAIDDFGTGYSNISYLQRLDVDQLKLDQLFIRGLERDTNTAQLVDSLIDFGNRMGLTLIAEGIETENQYEYLRARGVQYGQGWLFSRALPLEEFERFLDSQNT